MPQWFALFVFALALVAAPDATARDATPDGSSAAGITRVDAYTIRGARNLITGYEPTNPDGTINVVVEIPTGTTQKWEVDKPSGDLRWEFKKGKPRIVGFLGYPGNYGMVPRTLLAKEQGGDGDPLDVIVLGPAVQRGSVVKARVVGVLRLLDRGERDDKVLAVLDGDPLAAASSVEELDQKFPGVTKIVEVWFQNYKGPGKMEALGFAGPADAREIIATAAAAFQKP